MYFAWDYSRNIVIFSRTPDEHIEHFGQVLMLLNNADVTLIFRKLYFFTISIDFLGHLICPGCLRMLTRTIAAVCGLEHPINRTELRSILGLFNVFQHFVSTFACVAAQLNKKLQKGQLQIFDGFSDREITAFGDTIREVKRALSTGTPSFPSIIL